MAMEYIEGIPLLRPYVDYDNKGFWAAIREHRLSFKDAVNAD